MEFTSDSAKRFPLSKLAEQAMRDGVVQDEIEKRIFLFSEESGSPGFEAQERLDKEYDSKAYESKVTKPLGRSYARDQRAAGEKASWKAALKALSKEDFYGLVMLGQAKRPRFDAGLGTFLCGMLPFALVELVVVGTGLIVVFQPPAVRLHLPDWFRLLLLPVFFWLFWYAGKVFDWIQLATSIPRNESEQR